MAGSLDEVVAKLNPAQREAATAVNGPLAILAGAGTGKTTTITHRIACQVAGGAFRPSQILAVTFTEKAAGELKARLARLGVEGVEARTFHAAALSQLSRLWERHTGSPVGDILDSKAPLISSLANALPAPHKFIPRRDLATEIEWAKNRMVGPDRYVDELDATEHTPPIPSNLMERIFDGYERRKRATGKLDFEDMLARTIALLDEHDAAARDVRDRFHAFTVDEYQDVNPLQQALLERWLGGRDELCVVGDDYQTIYGFTGATPEHLLTFQDRYPSARMVRLEESYRSTPEVLAVANRLADRLGGFRKELRATRPSGPGPITKALPSEAAEASFVVGEVRRLHDDERVPLEEMAILYRINARSERFEEALAQAGIAFQVRDGAFLRRPGPRAALARLRRGSSATSVAHDVERITAELGYDPEAAPDSEEETTRQSDLSRLRALATEFSEALPDAGPGDFLDELTRRFSVERSGRGVNLMTFHRAKGLEFEAVFLPRLLDGEIPFRAGRSKAPVEEERRLLYVGITRAKRHLFLTWPTDSRARRSAFVDELDPKARTAPPPAPVDGRPVRRLRMGRPCPDCGVTVDAWPHACQGSREEDPLFGALRSWRLERARRDGVPAYVVFHDSTLAEIAMTGPRTIPELGRVSGVGPAKLERYGAEVLQVVSAARTP